MPNSPVSPMWAHRKLAELPDVPRPRSSIGHVVYTFSDCLVTIRPLLTGSSVSSDSSCDSAVTVRCDSVSGVLSDQCVNETGSEEFMAKIWFLVVLACAACIPAGAQSQATQYQDGKIIAVNKLPGYSSSGGADAPVGVPSRQI